MSAIRALAVLPTELKPRISPRSLLMNSGLWMLTPPPWRCLRGLALGYHSRSPFALVEHWLLDIEDTHDEAAEVLIYRARREWREYQAMQLHTGRM